MAEKCNSEVKRLLSEWFNNFTNPKTHMSALNSSGLSIVVDVDTFDYYEADSLTEDSQDHRTVSSLLHSKVSPAAFGAPLWWW